MPDNRYQEIVKEMETGTFNKEIWLQALEKSGGKQSSATSNYITLRAEQLYRENTPKHIQVFHKVKDLLNVRTPRGLTIVSLLTITILFLGLLLAQPSLRANALVRYNELCRQAKTVLGGTQVDMRRTLGEPVAINDSGSAFLVFTYNRSSALCMNKSRFDLRIFVDTRTARVSGWEENPLMRTSSVQ